MSELASLARPEFYQINKWNRYCNELFPVKALSRGLENLGVVMPSYLVFSVLMIRYKIGIFSEISLIGLRNRSHFAELAFQCLTPKGV